MLLKTLILILGSILVASQEIELDLDIAVMISSEVGFDISNSINTGTSSLESSIDGDVL